MELKGTIGWLEMKFVMGKGDDTLEVGEDNVEELVVVRLDMEI